MNSMAFFGGFLYMPLVHPVIDTLTFLGMKGAKVVFISCKFFLHLACSSWLFNLQMFFYLQKANVNPHPLPPPPPLKTFLFSCRYIYIFLVYIYFYIYLSSSTGKEWGFEEGRGGGLSLLSAGRKTFANWKVTNYKPDVKKTYMR